MYMCQIVCVCADGTEYQQYLVQQQWNQRTFYSNILHIHALTEADIIQTLILAICYIYLVLRTH